jgi:biotin transport system substrate-specific component
VSAPAFGPGPGPAPAHSNRSATLARSARFSAASRDLATALAASLAVGMAAQASVPIPGSPVPVTGQTLALLLVGFFLGARRGALALALYIAEGVAGLPVFAGGAAGPGVLVGPTAGYLLSFPAAAWVAGALASPRSSVARIVLASLASHAVIFAGGLAVLARFVGPGNAVATGLLPFLPGEAIKIASALVILRGWTTLRRPRA